MKITLRLPTQDPYAYLEVEMEAKDINEALEAYSEAMRAIKSGGITDKEFDGFVQRQLLGQNKSEDYILMELMSVEQRWFINCNKRAMDRINAK